MRLYRQQFGWQAYIIQGRELPAIRWDELEEEAKVVLEKDANGEKVLKLDAEDDDADIDWGVRPFILRAPVCVAHRDVVSAP